VFRTGVDLVGQTDADRRTRRSVHPCIGRLAPFRGRHAAVASASTALKISNRGTCLSHAILRAGSEAAPFVSQTECATFPGKPFSFTQSLMVYLSVRLCAGCRSKNLGCSQRIIDSSVADSAASAEISGCSPVSTLNGSKQSAETLGAPQTAPMYG
jgi:hypothetical protein